MPVLRVLVLWTFAIGAARAEPDPVRVRWLGVAGFSLGDGETTLLHDPYFSRPGLWRTLFARYRPDEAVLAPLLGPSSPAPELERGQLILIGHSHFDHLGDAPWIAARTGATVAGSATTVAISQGYGLAAAQTRRADPGDVLEVGQFEIRVVESRHAKVVLGRVPLPGELTEPPDAPIHAVSFKLGDARGYLVTHRASGVRVYLLSSAGTHPPALEGLLEPGARVDLLLAAGQGRQPELARELVTALRPRVAVAHHFDDFFRALDHAEAGAPADPEDFAAFTSELRDAGRHAGIDVEVRSLALWEALSLQPAPGGGSGSWR
jgi:L-ascorbate metabolism protein UlaG (beta-lactamase superfamily)